MLKSNYAVVWSNGQGVDSGRLEPEKHGFELIGRNHRLSVAFADLADAAIARGESERLRGLPVLVLRLRSGAEVRLASLEGVGALRELLDYAGYAAASR